MILVVKIKLTQPLLGELKPDQKGLRRFKKLNGRIHVNILEWQTKLADAAKQLGYTVDVSAVIPQPHYLPASVHTYRRIWSRVHCEVFECFRKGTVLTLEFLIREEQKRCPTPHELKRMFEVCGEYLGLSQWGSKFGYGRFEVMLVAPKNFETEQHAETCTTQNNLYESNGSAEIS